MGERQLYYLLAQSDPDFNELFKIAADFDDEFVRDDETTGAVRAAHRRHRRAARACCRSTAPRSAAWWSTPRAWPATRSASRPRCATIVDLLRGGRPLGRREQAELVERRARAAGDRRADLPLGPRARRACGTTCCARPCSSTPTGPRSARSTACRCSRMGTFSFGRPSRITARVHLGKGEVIDIEREVELGGPLHSKGVLILSGFLRGRYAQERPLSLGASLVFEQSYGGVDGDSASSAELYALLSAIARVPISAVVRGDRLGQPARRGPGHRRRQREDRGLLRPVQGARADRRPGRADPRGQRQAPDAAPRRGGGRRRRAVRHLSHRARSTRASRS